MAAPSPAPRRSNRIQSVQRALAILRAFDDAHPELGISDLARRLDLSKSIVMRLVATLRDEGFLERSPGGQKYRIGLGAFEVGNLYYLNVSLRREAEPLVTQLAERLGYSAYLGTLQGHRAIYLLVVEGPGPVRVAPRIGGWAPAHTTAAGKALLAFLPPSELEHVLATAPLEPDTPRSITSRAELRAELERVRAQGFAVARGEHLDGVGAVGAPIFDRRGVAVASISVAFLLYLVSEEQWPGIAATVVETARQISRRLGTAEPRPAVPSGRE